jgi:hypothetical protein
MMNDPQAKALEELLELAGNADTGVAVERARVLALQWPSLAAALANLLTAHSMRTPRPWRTAARLAAEERGYALTANAEDDPQPVLQPRPPDNYEWL